MNKEDRFKLYGVNLTFLCCTFVTLSPKIYTIYEMIFSVNSHADL